MHAAAAATAMAAAVGVSAKFYRVIARATRFYGIHFTTIP